MPIRFNPFTASMDMGLTQAQAQAVTELSLRAVRTFATCAEARANVTAQMKRIEIEGRGAFVFSAGSTEADAGGESTTVLRRSGIDGAWFRTGAALSLLLPTGEIAEADGVTATGASVAVVDGVAVINVPTVPKTSPAEAGAAYIWKSDAGVVTTDSGLVQMYPTGFTGWTAVAATARGGFPDHLGTNTAARVVGDGTSGAHYINVGYDHLAGAPSANTSIAQLIVMKSIGVWVYTKDAGDTTPQWRIKDGTIVDVSLGATSSSEVRALGNDWYEYTITSRGDWTVGADNGTGICGFLVMGDESGFLNKTFTSSQGFYVERATTIQLEEALTVASQGTLSASLASNPTYRVELMPKGFRDGPLFWAPPSTVAFFSSTDATLISKVTAGSTFTVQMLIKLDKIPTLASTLFSCHQAGSALTIGTDAYARPYAGLWGGVVIYAADVLEVARWYVLTLVVRNDRAQFFIDGHVASDVAATALGVASNGILWGFRDTSQGKELDIFDRALSASEVLAQANYLLGKAHNPNEIVFYNDELVDTAPRRRLPFAEKHLLLDGSPTSCQLVYYNDWAGQAGHAWGPAVFAVDADGVRTALGVVTIGATAGLGTERFAIPAGSKRLIVRDGTAADNCKGVRASKLRISGASPIVATAPAHRIVVLCDSVGAGFNAGSNATLGWTQSLRDDLPAGYRLSVYGWGGLALHTLGDSASTRTALATELAPLFDGTESNTLIYALGINDATNLAAYWTDAAGYLAAVVDYFTKQQALVPGLNLVSVGQHACDPDTAQVDVRAANLAAVAGLPRAYTSNLGPETVDLDSGDVTGLHPSPTGMDQIKAFHKARLIALGLVTP